MKKRNKQISKKAIAITLVVTSLMLVTATILPSQTDASIFEDPDDKAFDTPYQAAGAGAGGLVAGAPGAVAGSAAGKSLGEWYENLTNNMDPEQGELVDHYARERVSSIRQARNSTQTAAHNSQEWAEMAKYFFYRKTEYGAATLYDTGAREYSREFIFEHTSVAKEMNTWVWQVSNEHTTKLDSYEWLGQEFTGDYSALSAEIAFTPDPDDVYDTRTTPNYGLHVYSAMLLGQEPFYHTEYPITTIFNTDDDVSVEFHDTDGSLIDFRYRHNTAAWSDYVTSKDFGVEVGDDVQIRLNVSDSKYTEYCEQVIKDSDGNRLTSKDNQVYSIGYASKPYADVYQPAMALWEKPLEGGEVTFSEIDFEGMRIWGNPFDLDSDPYYTDITENGLREGAVKSDDTVFRITGSPNGTYSCDLDPVYDDMRDISLNATQTLQEADNMAQAQFMQLLDQGGGPVLPVDLAFPDPNQLEGMNATEIWAVFTVLMHKARQYEEETNYTYDLADIYLSNASFDDLRCTGTIKDEEGNFVAGNTSTPIVFTPFVTIKSTTLETGLNTFNQRGFCFRLGDARNSSTAEIKGDMLDPKHIELKNNYTLNITAIRVKKDSGLKYVDSIDLNITGLDLIISEHGSAPGTPDIYDEEPSTWLDWFQKYWFPVSIAGFGVAIGFAATDPEIKIIGGVLLVAGIILYALFFFYHNWLADISIWDTMATQLKIWRLMW